MTRSGQGTTPTTHNNSTRGKFSFCRAEYFREWRRCCCCFLRESCWNSHTWDEVQGASEQPPRSFTSCCVASRTQAFGWECIREVARTAHFSFANATIQSEFLTTPEAVVDNQEHYSFRFSNRITIRRNPRCRRNTFPHVSIFFQLDSRTIIFATPPMTQIVTTRWNPESKHISEIKIR